MFFLYGERKCGHMEMFAISTLFKFDFLVAQSAKICAVRGTVKYCWSLALLLQKYVPTGAKTMNKYLCTRHGQQTP